MKHSWAQNWSIHSSHSVYMIVLHKNNSLFHHLLSVEMFSSVRAKARLECRVQHVCVCVCCRWIVFDEPGFCGRHYVLEKGLYSSPEDWGSSNSRILSVIPIMLVGNTFCSNLTLNKHEKMFQSAVMCWLWSCVVLQENQNSSHFKVCERNLSFYITIVTNRRTAKVMLKAVMMYSLS